MSYDLTRYVASLDMSSEDPFTFTITCNPGGQRSASAKFFDPLTYAKATVARALARPARPRQGHPGGSRRARTRRARAGSRSPPSRASAPASCVEERLLAAGIVPASVDRFDDNGMIQALVATGEGIAVVPELTIDPGDERIAVHPLASLPARRLAAVLHRERWLAPAAAGLVDTACQLEGGGRNSTSCSPASATTASGV
jgi:DNA-binding transcriptional LysR family regulator